MKVRARYGVVLVLVVIVTASLATRAGQNFSVSGRPDWVVDVGVPAADEGRDARDGILDLLDDTQIRVTDAEVQEYHRDVTKVLTAAGLEQASQIELDFDPSDERLVIHAINVVRGDQTINALRPSDIRVIQPERDLDSQIVTGEMSAVALLNDVRVGDVIDYSYSLNSTSKLFGGKFAYEFYLGALYPVRRVSNRLLWPAGRPVWFKNLNTDVAPVQRELAGATEYTWAREKAPAVKVDSDAPSWFDPTPTVQASEWATWSDVVKWAEPFYKSEKPLPPELERQIAEWKALPTPQDQLVAASRFVQDQIRYTGIELGPGSFVPSDPSVVYQRRFGDCKDKSVLLATILGQLGVEAYPALVNTTSGQVLPDWQPSPLSFDHCIVRATVGPETYWIDATASLSRGDLSQHRNPDFGYALVVRDGTAGLEQIAEADTDTPTVAVREQFTIDGDDARLEVVTTYRGDDADDVRYSFAGSSIDEIGESVLDYYEQEFATIELEQPPVISDDEAANVIVMTENYRITGFWEDGARTFSADRVDSYLSPTRSARRTGPLAISYPVDVSQTIDIRTGRQLGIKAESGTLGDDTVRFTYNFGPTATGATLDYHFKTLRDHVPQAKVAQHRETIRKIRKMVAYTIKRDGVAAMDVTPLGVLVLVAAITIPLGLIIYALWWRSRKDGARLAEQMAAVTRVPVRGDSPATAIDVATEDDRRGLLATIKCRCGTLYSSGLGTPREQTMVYDGRTITLITLTCSACNLQRDLYVAATPVGARD
ncbi:MAG TPA: DUF3857 domain-containing transglutaminase family protein [Blastocatellia bacterium]|nr:DUF3857 domain-containing transglutaminase family protein [Blastocatellia bacterium]